LAKIYTLPNIEISEAFLKLREQAWCYYQKPGEPQAGLEVINNTNLVYFSTSQKAAFLTLKGMFYAQLSKNDNANTLFGQAVQLDMSQPKAWGEWGLDVLFKTSTLERYDVFW
jgi:transformation/transcription domain-associated protein